MKAPVLVLAILLSSCASVPELRDSEARVCEREFVSASSAGLPAFSSEVSGFPYLRTNRFLAEFAKRELNPNQMSAWLNLMLREYVQAIRLGGVSANLESLQRCGSDLIKNDLQLPERLAAIRRAVEVPDDYQTIKQVIGLYPIPAVGVRIGLLRWQRQASQMFEGSVGDIPIRGQLKRYSMGASNSDMLVAMKRNSLGMPEPSDKQLQQLLTLYAPTWEIDTVGEFDKPGAPIWMGPREPSVDTSETDTYTYQSYTFWQGRPVLQLNYVVWFSERPPEKRVDILAGALDGLHWRVTLDGSGQPLIYDSIHPCGCFHQFFPTGKLALRPESTQLPEPPFVPQSAPLVKPSQRLVIRIQSGTHYIQRVYADVNTAEPYQQINYDQLYNLSGEGRSLFDERGLVPGTERSERWILWPMGIASPGGMRERGRHATAFVGRRHFDDAHLLDELFQRIEAPQ